MCDARERSRLGGFCVEIRGTAPELQFLCEIIMCYTFTSDAKRDERSVCFKGDCFATGTLWNGVKSDL